MRFAGAGRTEADKRTRASMVKYKLSALMRGISVSIKISNSEAGAYNSVIWVGGERGRVAPPSVFAGGCRNCVANNTDTDTRTRTRTHTHTYTDTQQLAHTCEKFNHECH